jgi:asparagine synthase (glutamine-hydrolysing)
MLMGNSVEGRFPFLDHRVMELAARLPPTLKMKVLVEKYLLKRYAERWVPREVFQRSKQPYRAPVGRSLAGAAAPAWAAERLSRRAVDEVGVFDGAKVEKLMQKLATQTGAPSEADNMAAMAVASTQLLAHSFLRDYPVPEHLVAGVEVQIA